MKIETYIDALISYGMNTGLAQPEDHMVLQNRLLEALQMDSYEPCDEPQPEELEEILAGLLDYACGKGICDDNITARDLFDTKLMGILTPMPREVIAAFREKFAINPRRLPTTTISSAVIPITSAATASKKICAGSTILLMASWILPST